MRLIQDVKDELVGSGFKIDHADSFGPTTVKLKQKPKPAAYSLSLSLTLTLTFTLSGACK